MASLKSYGLFISLALIIIPSRDFRQYITLTQMCLSSCLLFATLATLPLLVYHHINLFWPWYCYVATLLIFTKDTRCSICYNAFARHFPSRISCDDDLSKKQSINQSIDFPSQEESLIDLQLAELTAITENSLFRFPSVKQVKIKKTIFVSHSEFLEIDGSQHSLIQSTRTSMIIEFSSWVNCQMNKY